MTLMSVQADTNEFRFGTQSLRVSTGNTGSNAIYPSTDSVVVPGLVYTFSCYVKTAAALAASVTLQIAGGGTLTPVLFESAAVLDSTTYEDAVDGWTRMVLTFTAPEGVLFARPIVKYHGTTLGEIFWLDGIKFEPGALASTWAQNIVSKRLVLDQGAVQVDAMEGGLLRLRGSAGGTRDTMALGPHGLQFGGDVELYSALSGVLKTDGDLTAAGGDLILNTDVRLQRSAAKTAILDDAAGGNLTEFQPLAALVTLVGKLRLGLTSLIAAALAEGQTSWDDTVRGIYVGDSVQAKPVTAVGWQLQAVPYNYAPTDGTVTSALAAVSAGLGGTIVVPILVVSPMVLDAYLLRNGDAASLRTCEVRLYYNQKNNADTWTYVPASAATDSFTPSAASTRTVTLTGGAIVLPPGQYLLALRNTSAAQTWTYVRSATTTLGARTGMTKSIAALGATLDIVTAAWAGFSGTPHFALRGQYNGNGWS